MNFNLEQSERTSVLANERTYSAWVRTGLTALGVGLALEKFMGDVLPDKLIRSISSILILFSASAFILGSWRYHHVEVRMKSSSVTGAPRYLLMFISIMLMIAALLAIIGVWLM